MWLASDRTAEQKTPQAEECPWRLAFEVWHLAPDRQC